MLIFFCRGVRFKSRTSASIKGFVRPFVRPPLPTRPRLVLAAAGIGRVSGLVHIVWSTYICLCLIIPSDVCYVIKMF